VFDITSKAGVIIITINAKHPACQHLFELLREDNESVTESPALQGLKLLLTAWGRMEDEVSAERKIELEDIRGEWGPDRAGFHPRGGLIVMSNVREIKRGIVERRQPRYFLKISAIIF
jgi:hypothetical protein